MLTKNVICLAFIVLIIDSLLMAFALEKFLLPNTVLDDVINGIPIILSKIFDLPLSLLI